MDGHPAAGSVAQRAGAGVWSPLRSPLFRALWIATLASNVGTWMHEVGAGWLMASLNPSPAMVSLVQAATTLPIFLLALPAGTLADIVDRRRYLLAVQIWMAAVAALLGGLTLAGVAEEWTLVALTFAMGVGTALMMPAWAAVTPEVVPRATLPSAIALNSMGLNVARAVGPAIAGLIVSFAGTGAVFVLNAVSYLGVIVVLARWHRQVPASELPAERFMAGLRAGLRYARHAPLLQAAVIRGAGFFVFASAAWALLPLVAKRLDGGGPEAFGLLVASIGAGAVGGALALPRLREALSRDALVAAGATAFALATLGLAMLDSLPALSGALVLGGMAWIAVLSSLQVAAQMSLPGWVRSRGLAVFMGIFMGSMALGSVLWGQVAEALGIARALTLASAGGVLAAVLTLRWRVGGAESFDATPSMHWPTPAVVDTVTPDRGPVLITIEYAVREGRLEDFLGALRRLGQSRRRDGAYAWNVFERTDRPRHYIECFNVESWLEHLRQHERVTEAERALQEAIGRLLEAPAVVTHYVAPASARTGGA